MKTVVCFTCAVLCHLILLFSFHLGSSARPLPMSDESSLVEVNLVATAQEPAVEPAAPAEPLSTPEPTPMPTPEPTQTPNQEPASTSTSAIPEPPRRFPHVQHPPPNQPIRRPPSLEPAAMHRQSRDQLLLQQRDPVTVAIRLQNTRWKRDVFIRKESCYSRLR